MPDVFDTSYMCRAEPDRAELAIPVDGVAPSLTCYHVITTLTPPRKNVSATLTNDTSYMCRAEPQHNVRGRFCIVRLMFVMFG